MMVGGRLGVSVGQVNGQLEHYSTARKGLMAFAGGWYKFCEVASVGAETCSVHI